MLPRVPICALWGLCPACPRLPGVPQLEPCVPVYPCMPHTCSYTWYTPIPALMPSLRPLAPSAPICRLPPCPYPVRPHARNVCMCTRMCASCPLTRYTHVRTHTYLHTPCAHIPLYMPPLYRYPHI